MACNIELELDTNGDLYQVDSCSGISTLIGSVSALLAGISSQSYNSSTGELNLTISGVALPPTPLFLGIETTQTPLGSISNPNTPSNTALNSTRNLQTMLGLTPNKVALAGNASQASQAWTFTISSIVANRVRFSATPLDNILIGIVPNPTATCGALPIGFKWVLQVSVEAYIDLQGSATGHSKISSYPFLRVNGVSDQMSTTGGGGRVATSLHWPRKTGSYLHSLPFTLTGIYDLPQNSTCTVNLDMDLFDKWTEDVNIDPTNVIFDNPRFKVTSYFMAMKI